MSKGTILVAVSAADRIPLAGGVIGKTGTYLNELVVPVMTVVEAGYDYVLATPTGAKPIIDKWSWAVGHFENNQAAFEKAIAFFETDPAMQHPRTLTSVVADGLDKYAVCLRAGRPSTDRRPVAGCRLRHDTETFPHAFEADGAAVPWPDCPDLIADRDEGFPHGTGGQRYRCHQGCRRRGLALRGLQDDHLHQ